MVGVSTLVVRLVVFLSTVTLVSGLPRVPKLSKHPVLLVVSFDGFRSDYMSKTETPNLKTLQDEGIRVPFMRPQFPTKTFPNHQSIATGLYPDIHGITDNTVYDPKYGRVLSGFADEPEFWNYDPEVLPFWIRNEQAGDERYSGCYLWAGSSQGYGLNDTLFPTYYLPKYEESIPWETRVETVINWMTHEVKPANMVFLYHNEPDSQGHSFGAEDEETLAEIRRVDDRTGYLIQALKTANIYDKINIIVLSDHGMDTVHREDVINTTAMVDKDLYVNYGSTPVLQIMPNNLEDLNTIYDAFKAESEGKNFTAYKKEELIPIFNYGSNRRVMDIILLAFPGFPFDDSTYFNPNGVRGVHGYSNDAPEMQALFIARGPLFKKAYNATNPINNIDLVPLFGKIMEVNDVPSNGTLITISEILADNGGGGDGDEDDNGNLGILGK